MPCDDARVSQGTPRGDTYDWYVRGTRLLDDGHPGAAAELLAWVVASEPGSRSGWETLGRARYAARQYTAAEAAFRRLVDAAPDDDFARFGLGLSLWRLGHFPAAAEQLSLAVAMRPSREEYRRALEQVRATVRARRSAGLPDDAGAMDGTGDPS